MEAVKTSTMSVCGVQCDACEHYPDICLGCKALEGKPYWLQYVEDRDVCDIYECCKKSKKLKHCGHCHEPVSYTHLDVYKRQLRDRGSCTRRQINLHQGVYGKSSHSICQ